MATSTKLRDIQPGRLLQIAAKDGKRATAMEVRGVRLFQKAAQVSGVKLMRNGEVHTSGKVHSILVEDGDFLVTWDASNDVAAETSAPAAVATDPFSTPDAVNAS